MAEFIETTLMDGFADGPHVTEVQIGLANQATFGADDYVLEGGRESEAQVLTNNSIRIFDAVYCIQGRRDVIPASGYTDVTIANGTQGMNRNDIIVRRYKKNESSEIESTEYAVIKGTPNAGAAVDPEVTTGDIRSGATLHEMALYRVKITGLNITAVEPMFNILKNMASLQKEFAELNSKLKNAGLAICLAAHASALYIPTTNTININDYRCFVLQCCDSTGNRVLATDLIFPDQIAYGPAYEHAAVYAPEASNYIAYCYFGTDKKIYTKARSQYSSVRLYGIPKN